MNNSQSRPLLEAFGWGGTSRKAAKLRSQETAESGSLTQTVLAVLAILIPISVCVYLSDLEPLFQIKSVEFIHTDVIAILMLLLVVGRSLVKGFHGLPKNLTRALILFFVASSISALFAEDKLRAFAAIVQMLEFVAVAWCVSLISSLNLLKRVIHSIIVLFAFESLIGIWQFANSEVARGTFFNNQKYSMFMGGGAAICFALFAHEKDATRRWTYFVLMFVILGGALVGQERAPWLAFMLSSIAISWISKERRKILVVGLVTTVLIAVTAVLTIPPLREKTFSRIAEVNIQTEKKNTLLSRLAVWGVALKLFLDHPVVGVGPKNFVTLVPSFLTSDEMGGMEAADPHNVWIGILAEGGIIGFASYVWLCYSILMVGRRAIANPKYHHVRSVLFACLAYELFWFAMSYHYFTKGEGHIHFLIIGLCVGALRTPTAAPGRKLGAAA